MLLETWESADKSVRKDIINPGPFCKKPTDCAVCEIIIENLNVIGATIRDLNERYNSQILDNQNTKILIMGEANCEIDRQIERAIRMMMVLEKSLITINAFADDNDDQALIIKFELTLSKMEGHKPIWEWTVEEKYFVALRYKEIGVDLFKQSRYVDAFHKFSKGCKILITLEPIADLELDWKLESNINNLRLVLYNNMAGCQLIRKNYEHTISLCCKILNKENNNVKALYRRGVAYGNLRDLEKALKDLKTAAILEPHNQTIKEQFLIYSSKLQEANQKFEHMVRRMFKA